MASENTIITSLQDNMKWSDLSLKREEKFEAKAFCYKLTTSFSDSILRVLLLGALAFHGYNYVTSIRLLEIAPTLEQCSTATVTDIKKQLDMVKNTSLAGMIIMVGVIILSNLIESLDIKIRGPMHIVVSIIMLVIFIMNLVYLAKVKSLATNNCTVASPSQTDLTVFKKMTGDTEMWSGIGIGASIAWMGYYGYRIYADNQGVVPLTAGSILKSLKK